MRGILLLFIITVSFSFNYNIAQYNAGAKQIALSNSDIALSNDVFALFNNPAGLAQMNWREAGIYYSPAPFGLTELSNGFVAYNEPFSFGSVSLGATTYGFELYRETKFILGISYNYQNKFFVGAAVNFHNLSIKNYGSDLACYLNIGGLAYLSPELRLGFYFHNLNYATFGSDEDQIPAVISSGLSCDILSNLRFNLAFEKDIKYPFSFLMGLDYDIIRYLSLRTGFSTEPSRYTAGIGINYSIFSIDYALFTHSDLGLTHQAGIIISFGKEGERNTKIKEHLFSR